MFPRSLFLRDHFPQSFCAMWSIKFWINRVKLQTRRRQSMIKEHLSEIPNVRNRNLDFRFSWTVRLLKKNSFHSFHFILLDLLVPGFICHLASLFVYMSTVNFWFEKTMQWKQKLWIEQNGSPTVANKNCLTPTAACQSLQSFCRCLPKPTGIFKLCLVSFSKGLIQQGQQCLNKTGPRTFGRAPVQRNIVADRSGQSA